MKRATDVSITTNRTTNADHRQRSDSARTKGLLKVCVSEISGVASCFDLHGAELRRLDIGEQQSLGTGEHVGGLPSDVHHGLCILPMAGQPLQPVMTQKQIQPLKEHEKEEWRQFLLEQLISFLEQNRDSILSNYETINSTELSRQDIESHGLLDFDLSITLHQDRKQGFGLGSGFFKANLIR